MQLFKDRALVALVLRVVRRPVVLGGLNNLQRQWKALAMQGGYHQ